MITVPLDLDAVRAFVLIADLGSFTRAAEVLNTAQAAMSLKLKRLETALGCRLLDRTPRHVRLSGHGAQFIGAARELLAAEARALGSLASEPAQRLRLGISDHAAGPELPTMLARLNAYDPHLVVEVQIAPSRDIAHVFEDGRLDAAIVRREGTSRKGRLVLQDRLGWFAAPGWSRGPGRPLPLAALAAPCTVRSAAVEALDASGIAWQEVFVGGGVTAVAAAVTAGIAVAALARRVAPPGLVEVTERLQLPPLPASDVVVHSRIPDRRGQTALRTLLAALRGTAA